MRPATLRRRERMEGGSCRAARRPSRSPVKGAEAQRTGRGGLRRATQDVNVRGGKRTRAFSIVVPSKTPLGPSDGAFDPSVIEVPVRVAGVTRTIPGGLSQAGPCLPRAPGVADKTGACPELVEARPPRTGQRPVQRKMWALSLRRNGTPHHTPGVGPALRPALHRPPSGAAAKPRA